MAPRTGASDIYPAAVDLVGKLRCGRTAARLALDNFAPL